MMSGVWFVMYGGVVLTRVLANVESNEMGLHEVPKLLLLLGFGMDKMLTSFHTCGMILMPKASVYNCMR